MWDIINGTCEQTLRDHREAVYTVIQLYDGKVVSGGYDKTIKVREIYYVFFLSYGRQLLLLLSSLLSVSLLLLLLLLSLT